jgi:hypothetical protein
MSVCFRKRLLSLHSQFTDHKHRENWLGYLGLVVNLVKCKRDISNCEFAVTFHNSLLASMYAGTLCVFQFKFTDISCTDHTVDMILRQPVFCDYEGKMSPIYST